MRYLKLFERYENLLDTIPSEMNDIVNIARDEGFLVILENHGDYFNFQILNPYIDMNLYRSVVKDIINRVYNLTGNIEVRLVDKFHYIKQKDILGYSVGQQGASTLDEILLDVDFANFSTTNNKHNYFSGVVLFIKYDLM